MYTVWVTASRQAGYSLTPLHSHQKITPAPALQTSSPVPSLLSPLTPSSRLGQTDFDSVDSGNTLWEVERYGKPRLKGELIHCVLGIYDC